jgi:hypothetical protein
MEERLVLLTVSEVSDHDSGKGVAVNSHHGGQEAESMSVRAGFLTFPFFIPLGLPAYGVALSIFRVGLPFLVDLWKLSHRHTQRCAL